MRLSAAATLLLLVVYHAMRVAATQCSGTACDLYIPLSLLVPTGILVLVAVTGVLGYRAARRDAGTGSWPVVIVGTAFAGVLGPMAAALVLRDSPDPVVVISTLLVCLCPVCVLAYSWLGKRSAIRP